MELRQLQYFVTVVEERSVSRAAVRLHMTQPPLSTSVGRLEAEVGTPLLRRHARGVEPTDAGAYLADEARRLLRQLDDVAARTREVGSGRRGRVVVATVSPTTWQLLPTVLKAFHRRAPDVELDVVDTLPDEAVQRVREGRAGVALLYCADTATLGRSAAAGLQTAVIRREPLVVAVPRGHPAWGAGVIDLRDVAASPWIVPATRASFAGLPDLLRQGWQRAGISPRDQRSTATLATALALVAAGQGVTVLPSSASAVAGPDVHLAPLRQPVDPLEAALVWERDAASPVLAGFLAAALSTPEPDQLGQGLGRRREDPAD